MRRPKAPILHTQGVALEPGRVTREWPWAVQCYYGENVKHPKRPGDLAISTVHKSEASARIEEAAASLREDIGEVIVTGPWHDGRG